MTAALWLVVLGILIGGTAIPHAQDKPRVIPTDEDATICEPAETPPGPAPSRPGQPSEAIGATGASLQSALPGL